MSICRRDARLFLWTSITRNQAKRSTFTTPCRHVHGPILRTPDSKPGSGKDALCGQRGLYGQNWSGNWSPNWTACTCREKTLIVFTGDNGTARFGFDKSTLGGRPIHGHKATMLEGGSAFR